jgi:hypothetical protein
MRNGMIRAIATTRFWCKERTDWHPEGSEEAMAAMHELLGKQIDTCCIDWERWEDDLGGLTLSRESTREGRIKNRGW